MTEKITCPCCGSTKRMKRPPIAPGLSHITEICNECGCNWNQGRRVEPAPSLYDVLCKSIIARIMEADANCEPPTDIMLRLESIIRERDRLRTPAPKEVPEIPNAVGCVKLSNIVEGGWFRFLDGNVALLLVKHGAQHTIDPYYPYPDNKWLKHVNKSCFSGGDTLVIPVHPPVGLERAVDLTPPSRSWRR